MNKIFKAFLFTMLMVVTMTGCREDAEMVDPGTPGHPEKDMQGTFTGTWTVYNVDTDVTSTYPGSITLTDGGKAYATEVTVVCPDQNMDWTSTAYIIKQSAGYKFANEIETNPIGAKFTGGVTADGVASIAFKKVAREGRKSYVFQFSFSGSK